MADMATILELEQNDLSNSKSPCGQNASHQVWAQSDLGFRSRCVFNISKLNDLSNSESLCRSDASYQVSAQSNLKFGRCCLKNFKMDAMLGYWNRTILAILNLYVALMPPINPLIDWLCWGLTTRQPLRVILCRLPEKGRKEIEERVEEMKERDREERGNKNIPPLPLPTTRIAGLAQL